MESNTFNPETEPSQILAAHALFEHCTQEELNAIADKMQLKTFAPGEIIIKQGDAVSSVYFIVSGDTEVTKSNLDNPAENLPIARLGPGEAIGLTATGFFSKTGTRSANVVAIDSVQTYRLLVKDIQHLQRLYPTLLTHMRDQVDLYHRLDFIKQVKPFAHLTIQQINELANSLKEVSYPAQTTIFQENDPSDACYFILEGQAEVLHENNLIVKLGQYDIFGEAGIMLNNPRNATVKTSAGCVCYVLKATDFMKVIEKNTAALIHISRIARNYCLVLKTGDYEVYPRRNKDGEAIYLLKHVDNFNLMELSEEGLYAWQLINDKRTLQDIVDLMREKYPHIKINAVVIFLMDMQEEGFLKVKNYPRKYYELEKHLSLFHRCLLFLPRIFEQFLTFKNVDPWLGKTYRYFKWFFTPTCQTIVIAIILVRFVCFIRMIPCHFNDYSCLMASNNT